MDGYQHIIKRLPRMGDVELEVTVKGLIAKANELIQVPNYQGYPERAVVLQTLNFAYDELEERWWEEHLEVEYWEEYYWTEYY